MKRCILVVDPTSSSEYLVNKANEKDIELIALKTFNINNHYFDYHKLNYKIITSNGSVIDDIKKIMPYQCIIGFYGNENSVEYADKILTQLFPEASNKMPSKFRYNKFHMLEQINKYKLPCIKQILLNHQQSMSELINITYDYFCKNNNQMIIKPASGSAGSQGVFSPSSKKEIIDYFQQGDKNFLYATGDYLLQQKITGIEYYVDTASYQGKHTIVSIGRYKKTFISGSNQYIYAENLDIYDPTFNQFKKQIKQILEILGMHTGLAHLEFLKSDEKFYLLEINPRISGAHGVINYMSKLLTSYDQIDAFLDLIEGNKRLDKCYPVF